MSNDSKRLIHLGDSCYQAGQYEEALTHFEAAITLNATDAWSWAHRGETYCKLQQYPQALADFNQAIALKADYAWALAHRGETHYQMQQYDKALHDFDQALALKPDYFWALARRGLVHRHLRAYERALADLTLAIRLKPDYAWALVHRTETYVALRRYEEALTDAWRAIMIDDQIVPFWRGEYSLLFNYLGRYEEAIACCRVAIQEDVTDYVAWYTLAVALALGRGGEQAEIAIKQTQTLLQAVVQSEVVAGVYYRLGGLAALQNRVEAALMYLQRAIMLDDEPLEMARHDPAWRPMQTEPRFRALVKW